MAAADDGRNSGGLRQRKARRGLPQARRNHLSGATPIGKRQAQNLGSGGPGPSNEPRSGCCTPFGREIPSEDGGENSRSKRSAWGGRQKTMSLTTAFIGELIRAANEVERLTPYEISRLLDRSVDTIRDMRRQTGIAASHRARDVVIDLQLASARARDLSAAETRDVLLDAADIIRTLKIVLDGKE
ncbi:hypothetical protein GOB46_05545 [Sinorhizobium meliloti]|nr:hypothetical protein [Sinorhizobium meliloti]MDW9870707.1 hypothetical protein [Sinorhizobium meliloti]MDW9883349.1 hypothetical protein [Sinorhizobium meliloti]MDX0205127.1 hypothetical protein [Sinorhizobium meliloti]